MLLMLGGRGESDGVRTPAAELAAAEPITKKAHVARVNVPSQMRRRHDLGTSNADTPIFLG
jgi:hypothetical protein